MTALPWLRQNKAAVVVDLRKSSHAQGPLDHVTILKITPAGYIHVTGNHQKFSLHMRRNIQGHIVYQDRGGCILIDSNHPFVTGEWDEIDPILPDPVGDAFDELEEAAVEAEDAILSIAAQFINSRKTTESAYRLGSSEVTGTLVADKIRAAVDTATTALSGIKFETLLDAARRVDSERARLADPHG
jgi:hypothetical protein